MWFFEEEIDDTIPAPTQILDFRQSLPEGVSLSRTVSALGRDPSGRWISYSPNTLRFWHDPVTFKGPYALIEPERTQLLYQTRHPVPASNQSTISYDAAMQTPFGLGAITISPNTTLVTHGWNLFFGTATQGAAIADNSTVAIYTVLKPANGFTDITFFLQNKTGLYSSVRISLVGSGSIVSQSGIISADVEKDTDGFYGVKIVNNYGAGLTAGAFNAGIHDNTGNRTFSGTGIPAFHVSYVGAELGLEATSPIVNAGLTTVTRTADVVTSQVDWIAAGAKSFGINYIPMSKSLSTVYSAAGTDRMELKNTPSTMTYVAMNGAVEVASITGDSPALFVPRTVVVSSSKDLSIAAQDGEIVGIDNLGDTQGAMTSLRLGDRVGGGNGGAVLVSMMKFWTTALDTASALSFSEDFFQIVDTPPLPAVSVQPTMTIIADSNTVTLLVVLTGESTGATVNYQTVDETALSGIDYTGVSGSVVIDVGSTSALITVPLAVRGTIADKTFRIVLTSAVGASLAQDTCVILLLKNGLISASTQLDLAATLPPELSLTRQSSAWTRNSTGVWTSVAANGYRQHFVSATTSGLLLEPAPATQNLFDSVNPGFAATAGTITMRTTEVTPTGSRFLEFREDATTGEHRISLLLSGANSVTPAGELTVSVMIRPRLRSYIRMSVRGTDNVLRSINMDLSTTKAVTSSDFGVVFGIETDPFRPDWNRIFVNYPQSASAGVQAQIILTSQDSFNITSIPGATTSGFDLCHVQLESGSGMSSPIIVTAGSAPTVRAADVLKASGAWYKIANYSLGFQFRRLRNQPSLQQLWMTRDTANAVNGVSMTNGVIGFDTPANAATMSQETVGTGSQTAWQIPNPQLDGPFPLVVSVDGVVQAVGSYTLGTTSFSFSEAPPPGSLVDFRGLGGATMVAAQSVGTGSQTAFTAPTLEGGQAVIAMIDGVVQATSAYTLSGQTVTFSEAVPPGSLVDIRSVSSVIVIMEETAPGGLTTFTLPTSATSPKLALLVVIDGLLQPMTSYTVTLNKLVFSQAPPSGALVDFRIFTV